MLVCKITKDKYNPLLTQSFKSKLSNVLITNGAETIPNIAKNRIINDIQNISISSDTINGIPKQDAINQLINGLESEFVQFGKYNGYKIGWMDENTSRIAALIEYGSQLDETIEAQSILTKLILSQEKSSFDAIIRKKIAFSLKEIEKSLEVK